VFIFPVMMVKPQVNIYYSLGYPFFFVICLRLHLTHSLSVHTYPFPQFTTEKGKKNILWYSNKRKSTLNIFVIFYFIRAGYNGWMMYHLLTDFSLDSSQMIKEKCKSREREILHEIWKMSVLITHDKWKKYDDDLSGLDSTLYDLCVQLSSQSSHVA
jgi:hypothetical protein